MMACPRPLCQRVCPFCDIIRSGSQMFYNRDAQRWEGGEEVDLSGFDSDEESQGEASFSRPIRPYPA